jgi:hypothetical protein
MLDSRNSYTAVSEGDKINNKPITYFKYFCFVLGLEPGLCVCGIHTLPLSYTLSSLNAFFLS